MNGSVDIKLIRSLSRKKYRDEYGLFVVEGEKMVKEAAESPFEVVSLLRQEDVGERVMTKISMLATPSPVLAVVRKPSDYVLSDSLLPEYIGGKGLYLALDSIRDPGNLGTIIRTADWFGLDGVFASPDTVDIFNPKVVQSTMGAIFRVKFHYCSIPFLCRTVTDAGGNVYGTFLNGENLYSQELGAGDSAPSLIVVGNESNGISSEVAAEVSRRLTIPSFRNGSESLNAAVAAAVTIAEFRRRSSPLQE